MSIIYPGFFHFRFFGYNHDFFLFKKYSRFNSQPMHDLKRHASINDLTMGESYIILLNQFYKLS